MTRPAVVTGFYRCPVCNRRHTDTMLLGVQALGAEFLGWALCPKDEELYAQGFIALVEVTEAPEEATAWEQLEAADRTGNVFHVLLDRWGTLFLAEPPPEGMPLQFITPDGVQDVQEQNRLSLH